MNALSIALLVIAAFGEGLLIGYGLRCRYVGQGFRIMQEIARNRGVGHVDRDAPAFSAADVSRAFGILRKEEGR